MSIRKALLTAAASLTVFGGLAFAQTSVGIIENVSGNIIIIRDGVQYQAVEGSEIRDGDEIKVGEGASADISAITAGDCTVPVVAGAKGTVSADAVCSTGIEFTNMSTQELAGLGATEAVPTLLAPLLIAGGGAAAVAVAADDDDDGPSSP